MANQKANMHDIPLNTMDLCLNKFNSDIAPYVGFKKNNSPFYGSVLSPFYHKISSGVGNKSFVSSDGSIFSIRSNGSLYVKDAKTDEDVELIRLSSSKAITKDIKLVSGNVTFSQILGFINVPNSEPYMLCSSIEGGFAIINEDGEIVHSWERTDTNSYKPGETVHFCKIIDLGSGNHRYVWACGSMIYYTDFQNVNVLHSYSLSGQSEYSLSSYPLISYGSNGTLFCIKAKSSTKTTIKYVPNNSNSMLPVKNIQYRVSGSPLLHTADTYGLWVDCNGNVTFFGYEASIPYSVAGYNYRVFHFGTVSGMSITLDEYYLDIDLNLDSYTDLTSIDETYYSTFSTILNDYTAYIIVGNNISSTIHVPAVYDYRWVQKQSTVQTQYDPTWWEYNKYKYDVTTSTVRVRYLKTPAHDETVSNTYQTKLINGVNKTIYTNVGVLNDGTYPFGLYAMIGNNFRLLYNNGVATAVSVTSDPSLMGSLICGYTEFSSTNPICHGFLSDGTEYLYYKNVANEWNIIKLVSDSTKFDLKVVNNRYIVINTNEYYNCYDTEERRPNHFAPDYNNRAILSVNYSTSESINSLAAYIRYCEQYNYGSGQGSNYTIINTPFISALWAQQLIYFPKNINNWTTMVFGSYTPDDLDIDIYYRKMVEGNALYRYSIDQADLFTRTYINSSLSGTVYEYNSTIYIPTLFAEFINGYVNQGIIIDNGHSYLQLYANNTKPIFGINLVDQLEGVSDAFVIHGQYFVVINNSIYSYNPNNYSTTAIVNIGNMKLVGYTPYQALFWSNTDKTFYTFAGDNTLNVLIQANEIDDIVNTAYNPNTMSIYLLTSNAIYIFGMKQLLRIDLPGYVKCYPINSGAVFVGEDALYLSYNKIEGYTKLPIILETKLYGEGNSVKSVNDCVYLRLYDEDKEPGQVKLSCETINEGAVKTVEKIFPVTKEMWDKDSGTIFLRYQPQLQAATGFSVKIVSPFAIATLQISSTPETIQNSKYNQ